tara:strand:- start:342 stop:638 length:297 start_codon:yes stop_codon:yes gene_type:complete
MIKRLILIQFIALVAISNPLHARGYLDRAAEEILVNGVVLHAMEDGTMSVFSVAYDNKMFRCLHGFIDKETWKPVKEIGYRQIRDGADLILYCYQSYD